MGILKFIKIPSIKFMIRICLNFEETALTLQSDHPSVGQIRFILLQIFFLDLSEVGIPIRIKKL